MILRSNLYPVPSLPFPGYQSCKHSTGIMDIIHREKCKKSGDEKTVEATLKKIDLVVKKIDDTIDDLVRQSKPKDKKLLISERQEAQFNEFYNKLFEALEEDGPSNEDYDAVFGTNNDNDGKLKHFRSLLSDKLTKHDSKNASKEIEAARHAISESSHTSVSNSA